MGPTLLLTAGLLIGQVQDVQVIAPEQPAPTGLFGRLRAWRSQPSIAPITMPANGPTEERSFLSRVGDRFGSMFGRGQGKATSSMGNGSPVNNSGTVIYNGRRVTTDEPPLLEQNPAPIPTNAPNLTPAPSKKF
ncbi:MAG: hypothetical protein HY040_19460 [Planctomycetes bacterium]|nr:hypothetical protein [Planctomycetota bacterium]